MWSKLTNKRNLYIFSVIICVIIFLWSLNGERYILKIFDDASKPWNEGWVQIVEDKEVELSETMNIEDVAVGDTLVLVNEIPELASDKVLFFYTKDIEAKVYVGDELLYSFEMQEKYEILETPGNMWNEVVIPSELSGEIIRIELTTNFSNRYWSTLNGIYLVESCQIKNILFSKDGYLILVTLVLFAMTINAYVNALVWKRRQIKQFFWGLGTVCLCASLWALGMSGLINFILDQPIVAYLLSLVMVPIIPVSIYEFLKTIYHKRSKSITYMGIVVWVNFLIQMMLQFVFGISLLTLLPVSIAIYIIGSVSILYIIAKYIVLHLREEGTEEEWNIALVSILIIFFGALMECLILIIYPEKTNLIGIAGVTGLLIYLILNQFLLTRFEARTDAEMLILEKSYNNLRNTTSVRQIEAHFFFNTLNTISALCKEDAKEADKAIRLFSSYMHSYMHLINEQQTITFVEELKLIESSLEIEKLRFPDRFTYTFDLEATEFKVPPLSLQPVVENAMFHGLRSLKTGGELKISTRNAIDDIHIIIEDNGIGFDTEILQETTSIGINNVKRRMKIMAKASVEIESEIGKGTKVIIKIPR